jgi:hypothetical protein
MIPPSGVCLLRKSFYVYFAVFVGATIATVLGCGGSGNGSNPIAPAGEQTPSALISSPAGTLFKEGENIIFSGSGTDHQDGPLDGSALTWISNIDGSIGNGSTVTTSALSAGPHEITLKAIDSDGNEFETSPTAINIEQTRFIKMGSQTSGVPDASNAFDGDHNTPATIVTPDSECIHFKAHIGNADTFMFMMKLGVSTSGSKLALQGLLSNGGWQPAGEYGLESDQTAKVTISNAQDFIDTEGYINLRIFRQGGAADDHTAVYEIWRIDPPYAGPQTARVDNPNLAFDTDPLTAATILHPLGSASGSSLHVKVFFGSTIADRFAFEIRLNEIGQFQYLSFDIENLTTSAWETMASLELNTTAARTVSIPVTSDHIDADGYISLRAYWANVSSSPPPAGVKVYGIQCVDTFHMDPRTSFGLIQNASNAVDQDLETYAIMHNPWGQNDRYDTLNAAAYLGDASTFTFSIKTAQSMNNYSSMLIIEGENRSNSWLEIRHIALTGETPATNIIEVPDVRQYVNADGWLNLRVRWEDHSKVVDPLANGYIYEIWPGAE